MSNDKSYIYLGYYIHKMGSYYWALGKKFFTLKSAKEYIDDYLITLSKNS